MNQNKLKLLSTEMITFIVSFFLFLITGNFGSASIINPSLERQMPGLESFEQGLHYFNEEHFEEAIPYFVQAIEDSYESSYSKHDFEPPYHDSMYDEVDAEWHFLYDEWLEIVYAVY